MYAFWGCGYRERYAGQGDRLPLALPHGAREQGCDEQPPEARTCPWYYDAQPFVQSIYELLSDWERGRLGDVWSLPASLVDYLRVAEDETALWTQYQREQVA